VDVNLDEEKDPVFTGEQLLNKHTWHNSVTLAGLFTKYVHFCVL